MLMDHGEIVEALNRIDIKSIAIVHATLAPILKEELANPKMAKLHSLTGTATAGSLTKKARMLKIYHHSGVGSVGAARAYQA